MDAFADRGRWDAVGPFVEMLWVRGNAYEAEVAAELCEPDPLRREGEVGTPKLHYGVQLALDTDLLSRLGVARNPRPHFREAASPPTTGLEHFLDIETDRLRDPCYLHGFVQQHPDAVVVYNSKYERTVYRALAEKHLEVCARSDVDARFAPGRTGFRYFHDTDQERHPAAQRE